MPRYWLILAILLGGWLASPVVPTTLACASTALLAQSFEESDAEADQVQRRLLWVGIMGGGLLALLGVLFAYLRLERASRGFHSGRLQMYALSAAALILLACYGLARQWALLG